MRIFMIGATGYIGKAVLTELTARGYEVYALVRGLQRFRPAVAHLPAGAQAAVIPVVGDLAQPGLGLGDADYRRIVEADIIIHAGGPMDIQLREADAERVFLHPAKELAELAVRIHRTKGLRQFIHVVGFMSPYDETNMLTNQEAALRHAPPYERCKFLADGLLRRALHSYGIPLSTVNPSVVIGDSRTGKTEQLGGLGILVDAVRRGLMPVVPGGDGYWLPMVHLDHVASFIGKLVRAEGIASDTYYMLDERADSPTMRALVRDIAAELRAMRPIGSVPPSWLKASLGGGIGRRLGIPAESMNFVVDREFPVRSKTALESMYGERTALAKDTLPYVIADLDYRLSHPAAEEPERFVRRRRGALATLEREGEGPPIVILHGTFSGADRFVPLAERLDGRRTILVDLPGFGRSPLPRGDSYLEDCVEAVSELVLELGEPAVLAGHSFGGLIAAMAMERIEPRIQRLALMQPVLQPIAKRYRAAGMTKTLQRWLTPSMFARELRKGGDFLEGGERKERYIAATIRDLRSPRIRHANAQAMSLLAFERSFPLRPETWNPDNVRILYGERDNAFRLPEPFRRFAVDALPYGHQFPIEAPERAGEWLE